MMLPIPQGEARLGREFESGAEEYRACADERTEVAGVEW